MYVTYKQSLKELIIWCVISKNKYQRQQVVLLIHKKFDKNFYRCNENMEFLNFGLLAGGNLRRKTLSFVL